MTRSCHFLSAALNGTDLSLPQALTHVSDTPCLILQTDMSDTPSVTPAAACRFNREDLHASRQDKRWPVSVNSPSAKRFRGVEDFWKRKYAELVSSVGDADAGTIEAEANSQL
jgi:hypothetical protein